jgi:beta-N-acetylhexosaminidase
MGPVMLDIAGPQPDSEEIGLIGHPRVGGVILFSRNYESPEQLRQLTAALHGIKPDLLIAVDHEGGRVQRFRQGFTVLPPMSALGELYDKDPQRARRAAHAAGFVLAWELRAQGVDFSFTPVLDLDFSRSAVIGNRAFHRDSAIVAELAGALCDGLHEAGFVSVGKHFPGHGYVEADSHLDLPVDTRTFEAIEEDDLVPFRQLIPGYLDGIMPAHVMYSAVDDKPAGFSPFWLQRVLRELLGFDGVIFSDDLSMKGADFAGSPAAKAFAALDAGCDMVLVCNDPPAARALVEGLEGFLMPADSVRRLVTLRQKTLTPAPDRSRYLVELEALQPLLDRSQLPAA